ncbi:MAG: response regulator transcription factor [Bacteroidetes bacterium]|nr:response regulator transcription factor [Bacteroidota bacterium]
MTKVFIIDDHELILEGIYSLLKDEKDLEWLGSAKTPEELMLFLKNKRPDVLLMDINLPQKNGMDLCLEIKKLYPAIHIIGLSTSDQASVIRKMLDNGASGYLLKDALKNEILEAIQTVLKGKIYVNHSVAEVLKKKNVNDSLPLLTKREKQVLELIAEGLTNQQIADKLFLDVTTINSHRKNMLTKYNLNNIASLIKFALTNNLI